jgi:hypothetical protein
MKIGLRVFLSVVVLVVLSLAGNFYSGVKTNIEAAAAVGQVKDSVVGYSFAQQMARGTFLPSYGVLYLIALALFVWIWWKPFARAVREEKNSNVALIALALLGVVSTTTGCMGPAKVLPLETVGPNETAFVIPMEGDSSNQAKFESVDFLRDHKVLSKRVEIPVRERSTGRWPGDFEWINTVRVIKVDRQLVTREWTKSGASGTSSKDEALSVASLDSINFHLGVNLTAFITEEDAPAYLYWHGMKPLSDVVDSNVRGYLQGIMANEFGKLKLEDCKIQKAAIFQKANDETIKKFREVGITISYVGSAQGFIYDDPAMQQKINETQTAEMQVKVATQKALEQVELNRAIVSKAIADRQAAEEFAKAADAQKAKVALDIEMVKAQAELAAANNLKDFKGQLPSVLPQGAPLLFGLDGGFKK